MTINQEKERKKIKRMELLELLNRDPEWHKKDNELTWAIQEKAKALAFPEQEFSMDLTVENYESLCEKKIPVKEMHKVFGLSRGRFQAWRKEHGFQKTLESQVPVT